MKKSTFRKIRDLVYSNSGISLTEKKYALVQARIAKRLRILGLNSYEDYIDYISGDKHEEEMVNLLNVISTNTTSFFRESDHFDILSDAVKQWRSEGQKKFRFWSAACSTGEEPYTMAMILNEIIEDKGVDLKILATDISIDALQACREGIYTEEKLKPVSEALKKKYFIREKNEKNVLYRADHSLKRFTTFARMNLSKPPYPMKGPFDVIFCRNVMIYFDNRVRQRMIREMSRLIKPGGYLLIGHSETLMGLESDFKTIRPSVYQSQGAGKPVTV